MTTATPAPDTIQLVSLDKLLPATDNLRQRPRNLDELAASIKTLGILEPIIATPEVIAKPADDHSGAWKATTDRLVIVAGARRHAAAALAGLKVVPVIVRRIDERTRVESMLVENLQRDDLEPLEEAEAYRRLGALGLSQKQIAERVGRSQAHISKRLSLLALPEPARAKMETGELSLSDGLELVEYADRPEVIAAVVKDLGAPTNRAYRPSAGVVAKQAAEELTRKAQRAAAIGKLAADKTPIVKTDQYGNPAGHPTELGDGWGRLTMTPAAHSKHPCHAAYVDHYGKVRYVCTKPTSHLKEVGAAGKSARALVREGRAGKSSDEAKAKAALTRERNKKLRDRAPERLKKTAALLGSARANERASDFILRQLLQIALDNTPNTAALVGQLLNAGGAKVPMREGLPDFAAWVSGGKSNARVRALAYAVALLSGETPFQTLTAKGYFDEELSANAARYIAHLKAAGYKPDAVELAQLKPVNKYRWRRPFDA